MAKGEVLSPKESEDWKADIQLDLLSAEGDMKEKFMKNS